MLTGEIRTQIDAIWNAFWTGGISNPLEVIEQITYLLFLKRLDDLHTLEENKAARLKKPMERRIFPEGTDPKGRPYEDLRWSRFKNLAPAEMFTVVDDHVFPFLRTLGGDDSTYAHHMKDARFTIPTPALLAKVVDMLDHVPMEDRDTKGDLYEYMLGKIATAGQNGQFRTPRHIIRLMVEMMEPTPTDVICDPACGTCGFLVAAGEYLRERHPEILQGRRGARALPPRHVPRLRLRQHDASHRQHEHAAARRREPGHPLSRFAGAGPRRRRRELHAGAGESAVRRVAGLRDRRQGLAAVVKTKKTELLFLALFIRLLKPGGRAAVIVPDGVLFGSSKAHKELRRMLVEDQKLDARDFPAERRVPSLRGCLHGDSDVHEDELGRHGLRVVLRRGCGRMESGRQADAAAAGREARCRFRSSR